MANTSMVKKVKVSRQAPPEGMTLETWQTLLRRQFGREQNFAFKNLGDRPDLLRFRGHAIRQTKRSYRVRIRGKHPGENFCTCPDFATNTLGTCKHIEFTLAALERKRGGRPRSQRAFSRHTAKSSALRRPPRSALPARHGHCPVELARLAVAFFDDDGVLLPEALRSFRGLPRRGRRVRPRAALSTTTCWPSSPRCATPSSAVASDRGVSAAASAVRPSRICSRLPLYDYQREGASVRRPRRPLSARRRDGPGQDDAGHRRRRDHGPALRRRAVLIVCPTSLKHQWQREIAALRVTRSVEVIGGCAPRREQQLRRADAFFKITNYDTVHARPRPDRRAGRRTWSSSTRPSASRTGTRASPAASSSIASPYALVLTGTPLENRLEELISIVQFVDRFRLGPTFRLLHEHQVRDDVRQGGRLPATSTSIGQTLEPILMRRHKDEVLDQLPERIDNNIFVPMTPPQTRSTTAKTGRSSPASCRSGGAIASSPKPTSAG